MPFYTVQGALPADAPSYVERAADHALMAALDAGEFCYILTSRQMGKSSLLAHARARLRAAGHHVVTLDLMNAGTRVTPEQWYDGLVMAIGSQLGLGDTLDDYWLDHERLGPVQRLFGALDEVVLPHLKPAPDGAPARLIVFVDEVDTVNSLPFYADEFFAAIRECYNARVSDPHFQRLTFCLSGVATLAELIRDPANTPFLMGTRIDLDDFPDAAVPVLARGLDREPALARDLVRRVFDWTHGHPYLTQRLCQAIADRPNFTGAADVDGLVSSLFLEPAAQDQEPNLAFVRERLLHSGPAREEALRLLDRIRRSQAVPDDEHNPAIAALRLSGIVRVERGLLVLRNRIYLQAFNDEWLRSLAVVLGDPDPRALAVLPFTEAGSENTDYLCDGLTNELIRVLGQVQGLRVVSSHSAFALKGRPAEPRRLALQLGVSLLLRGTVRRLGSRIQVSAELLSGTDARILWSTSHRQAAGEWRLLQEELARSVLDQLESDFGRRTAGVPMLRQKTGSPQAYNLYLKGLHHRGQRNEAALSRSLTCFQRALELDPQYAPALAGQAEAYILLGIYNCSAPSLAYPRAREAALQALEFEESLAEAHCALACTHALFDRDWPRAEQAFRRAIKLNPSYATARHWFSTLCLSPLGRHKEALEELRLAQIVDPLAPSIPASLALAHHLAGHPTEAAANARLALDLDENFWLPHLFLGWIHEQGRHLTDATEAFLNAISLSHGDPAAVASLAHLLASTGQTEAAVHQLDQLHAIARNRYVSPAEIALVCLALKRPAETRHWLEKAQEDHSFRLIYAQVDPRFLPAREDPLLAPLLR